MSMSSIQSINQQTMYDLCLMTYGTLDRLIKFITDNNILDVNYIPLLPQVFVYDPSLITDGKTNNYSYVTSFTQNYLLSETGGTLLSESGDTPLIAEL